MPSNRRIFLTTALLFFYLGIFTETVDAAINRQLNYSLSSEYNSDEDDQVFSDLQLNINDSFEATRFEGNFDLNSNLFMDHDENDSNDQHQGRLDSRFNFVRSSAWWNLNATVEVLPVDTGVEIEEFQSQTLTRLTTGPEISFWRSMRGSLDLALQVTEVSFSETTLDSTQTTASVVYNYPIDSNTNIGIDTSVSSTEYDDPDNAVNDFDLSSVGLFFDSRNRDISYSARAGTNTVENADGSKTNQDSLELNFAYTINSYSSLSLSLSESLQTSDVFNLLSGNRDESQFQSGLLQNRRIAAGYQYQLREFSAALEVFTNEVENVVSTIESNNEINGWSISLVDNLSDNFRIAASFSQTTNDAADVDEDDLAISLSYLLQHTREVSSEFVYFIDNESINGNDFDNSGLRYQFSSILF